MKQDLGLISVSVKRLHIELIKATRNPTRNRWCQRKQEDARRSMTVAALSSARSSFEPSCSEWCLVDCRIDSAALSLVLCLSCIKFCCAAPLVT